MILNGEGGQIEVLGKSEGLIPNRLALLIREGKIETEVFEVGEFVGV